MKKQLFVYCILTICIIQSCRKDTGTYPGTLADKVSKSMGTVTAKLNGKDWHSTLATINNNKKTTVISQHYLNEYDFEELGFDNLYLFKKTNNIRKDYIYDPSYDGGLINIPENDDSTHADFSVIDVDAVVASYNIDSSFDNYITVDSYNAGTGEVSGKFQVKFYLESTVDKSVYDSVVFTDGVYNLNMK